MPTIKANGINLFYEDSDPNNESGKEVLVFSHGLLMNHHMFDAQVAALSERYRCIAYDHRGQGQSQITEGGYDMETVAEDGSALIEALGLAPCHFAGLSMGGFVGMRLAARRPELLKSLILMETSADPEPAENVPKYNRMNFVAKWFGLRWVVNPVMAILFGKSFMSDPARANDRDTWKKRILSNDRTGITKAVVGVFTRKSVYDELANINLPTLIIVGEEDTATVPAKAERINGAIKDSKLVYIAKAGHSSSVEEPAAITATLEKFLSGL